MRRSRDFDNNRQPSPGGPLLTNHLRDLDIELELLKRKRDIIQQEQAIINRYSSKRQYDYQHSSNTYNRQEPVNQQFNIKNYSARYDGPSSSGNFTRPQAPKRQTPNQYWQPPSATKNFPATQKINPWQTSVPKQNSGFPNQNQKRFQAPHPRNPPNDIRPLMSIRPSIGQRVQKKFPNQKNFSTQKNLPNQKNFPTQRKDFKPTKVTKAKPQPLPNKLASYSADKAKKLVSQVVDPADSKKEFDQILRADKTPTLQMKGRLELALGTIIKEIKTENCTESDDLEYFQSPFIQRLLKHTIRTRIRTAMIDKVVGNIHDIVSNYRKKYPKETDIDLVQVAKDAQSLCNKTVGVAQLIESDDPEEFYKKNMVKALSTKMDEMFINLERFYMNKGKNLEELVEKMPEPKQANENEKKQNTTSDSHESSRGKINFENIVGEGENVLEAINEKLSKVKYYTELMDELIEFRLPKVLPKFKDMLLSIMLTDREFLGVKAMITSQIKRKLVKITGNEVTGESVDLTENKTKKSPAKMVPKAKANTSTTNPKATPATSASNTENKTDSSDVDVSIITETTEESSENPVPVISTEIFTVEDSNDGITDNPEKPVSDAVVSPPKASPAKSLENETSATPTKVATEKNIPATPKTAGAAELHFVKLISRPALPARAVIYDFLNQFKPASIKKHKSIANLLVIGFKNIEDYNKILTVNETVVGNATIVIKASEQVNKPKTDTSQSEVNEEAPKSADQSLADLSIGSDLEVQISDLLTSIRKADEGLKDDSSTQNNDDKMDTSENSKDVEDKNTANEENITKGDEKLAAKTDDKIDDSEEIKTNGGEKTESTTTPDEREISNNDNIDNKNDNFKSQEKDHKELETIAETVDEKTNEPDANKEVTKLDGDKLKDNLKESGRGTPTRSSSRLANVTPSTIRTRRASRLAQNN